MKFCHFDKISIPTCIFDDSEILEIGQDFNANCNQMPLHEIPLGPNSYSCPQGVYNTSLCV